MLVFIFLNILFIIQIIKIIKTFHHLLPEQTIEETTGLKDVWEDEAGSTSRLACMITLDKKHDDMIVFIPDSPPVDVIWIALK